MATQKAVQYLVNHPKESLDASLLSSAQPSLGLLGHFAACRPQLAGFEPIMTALLVSQELGLLIVYLYDWSAEKSIEWDMMRGLRERDSAG
jgi:hypothetical protein